MTGPPPKHTMSDRTVPAKQDPARGSDTRVGHSRHVASALRALRQPQQASPGGARPKERPRSPLRLRVRTSSTPDRPTCPKQAHAGPAAVMAPAETSSWRPHGRLGTHKLLGGDGRAAEVVEASLAEPACTSTIKGLRAQPCPVSVQPRPRARPKPGHSFTCGGRHPTSHPASASASGRRSPVQAARV